MISQNYSYVCVNKRKQLNFSFLSLIYTNPSVNNGTFTWIVESATGVESATIEFISVNCHCLQLNSPLLRLDLI